MKTLIKKLTLGVAMVVVATLPVQSQVYNFDAEIPGGGIAIPDNDPDGVQITREIVGSGITEIASVEFTFSISDGFNGDLVMGLSYAPFFDTGSPFSILLHRVGKTAGNPAGYAHSGFTSVTLSDSAINDIHMYGDVVDPGAGNPLVGGVWLPDARLADFPEATDATPRSGAHTLSAFQNLSADGHWTLWIADFSGGGGVSRLDSWTMTFVAVPEPSVMHLALGAGAFLAGLSMWRRRRQ